MKKFLLFKLVIILIFMMKSIRGEQNDDYNNNECEKIFVCRLSSEIFTLLTQALKINENFISIFLNSFVVNRKSEMTESFIKSLNEFKMMIVNYLSEIIKVDYDEVKNFINFKQLQSSNFNIFERETLKNIRNIRAFLENFNKPEYENNNVQKEFENIIKKCNQISTKIINNDLNAASQVYTLRSKTNVKIGQKDLVNDIKEILNSFQHPISTNFEEISHGMQNIKTFVNTETSKDQTNKIFNAIQHVFNILTKEEIKDFDMLESEITKCLHEIFNFFETIKQIKATNLLQNEFEVLKENVRNEVIKEEMEIDFFRNDYKNLAVATKVENQINNLQEDKINDFELELQKISNDTKFFYEFMTKDSIFVKTDQVDNYNQTYYEIENFINKTKEFLREMKINYGDNLVVEFIEQMIDDFERFYGKTIEYETDRQIMALNEFFEFMRQVKELNDALDLAKNQSNLDFLVDYEYFVINDEHEEEKVTENLLNETSAMTDEIETTSKFFIDDTTTEVQKKKEKISENILDETSIKTEEIETTSEYFIDDTTTEEQTSFNFSKLDSFFKKFNENLYTYADIENLQQQISKLIIMRQNISDTNMQIEVDKLVKQAQHLLERTRENHLKNYTRLQQLINIVKEKMSEERFGDMKVLDKHIEEINVLLPRMEMNYQIAAQSVLNDYKEFKKNMQERNFAMTRLEKIAFELKEGNFTGRNEEINSDIMEIAQIFKNTEYEKIVEVIFNKVNLILKSNEILNIADQILEAPESVFQLNLEQIYSVKEKILFISETTKNIITKQRANEIYEKLRARLKTFENEIMDKLDNVSKNLSPIESLDLEQLKTLSENLKSISKSVDNEQIMIKVDELLIEIRSIEQRFKEILDNLNFINSSLYIPSMKNDLKTLKSYLLVLTDLARFRESSIVLKAKELDATIKKLIYDFEVKNGLREINRELINIENVPTGNEINDNIMKLQNLEIKIEEIQADEETENDVQNVLNNINQMRQELPFISPKEKDAKVLKVIVNEIILIIKHIMSQIDELQIRLTHWDESNKYQFDELEILSNETNQIALNIEKIDEQLADIPLDKKDEEMIAKSNGNIKSIREQLISFNYLFNDTNMKFLYDSIMENLKNIENIDNLLEKISKKMNENENSTIADN